MKTLVNENTQTHLMEIINYKTSQTIGTYYYDADFNRWYIQEAVGKHSLRCVNFKTEKGAINYIEKQAEKYTTLPEAIKIRYGI